MGRDRNAPVPHLHVRQTGAIQFRRTSRRTQIIQPCRLCSGIPNSHLQPENPCMDARHLRAVHQSRSRNLHLAWNGRNGHDHRRHVVRNRGNIPDLQQPSRQTPRRLQQTRRHNGSPNAHLRIPPPPRRALAGTHRVRDQRKHYHPELRRRVLSRISLNAANRPTYRACHHHHRRSPTHHIATSYNIPPP